MRKSGRLFIVLGVGLALVAAALGIAAFAGGLGGSDKGSDPAKPDMATVVVAARDIPANTVLTAEDVQTSQIDKSKVPPGSVSAAGQVVGYAVSGDLIKGQQILSANLTAPGLTFDLENGKRAVALPVDRINALGGLIRPGDHIDLIYSARLHLTRVVPSEPLEVTDSTTGYAKDDTLTLAPPPGPSGSATYPYPGEPGSRFLVKDPTDGDPVTKIVIQNVRVVRVIAGDTTVSEDQPESSSAQGGTSTPTPQTAAEKLPNADLLVLEVDPQQAEVVKFLMDNNGTYQVALRPKDDTGAATTTGVTYEQLVTQYGLPVPKTVRLPGGGQ